MGGDGQFQPAQGCKFYVVRIRLALEEKSGLLQVNGLGEAEAETAILAEHNIFIFLPGA